jgi:hypothetical protein
MDGAARTGVAEQRERRKIMKRIAAVVLFWILVSVPAFARNHIFGNCDVGQRTVLVSGLNSSTKVQESLPACQVTVYDAGTSSLSVLYSDVTGTSLGNPFCWTSADGRWSAYTDSPDVDITFSPSSSCGTGSFSAYTILNYIGGSGIGSSIISLGAKCDGTTDDNSAFVAASAIGGSFYLPENRTCYVGTNTTLPKSVSIVTNSGKFSVASGKTLTIEGAVIAGPVQIFSGAGTVLLTGPIPDLYPQWWGAKCDGATDDSAALTSTVNAAIYSGYSIFIPASRGGCAFSHWVLPTNSNNHPVKIHGEGPMNGYGFNGVTTTNLFGSILKQTAIDGGDAISATSTVFAAPNYIFEDFTLLGPDTYSPRTNYSGNGISITGTAASPSLYMRNVYISNFYGSGKAAMWLDAVYNANVLSSRFEYSDIGLKLTGDSNLFRGSDLANRYCASRALDISSASGGIYEGTIESNEKTGIRFSGYRSGNWVFNNVWFENNNTTHTAGESAIVIKPDYVGLYTVVRDIDFFNPLFNVANPSYTFTEEPILYGDATHLVFGVRFHGGYWSGVGTYLAHLYGNVSNTKFEFADTLMPPSRIEQVLTGGYLPTGTVVTSGNGQREYGIAQVNINANADGSDSLGDLNIGNHFNVFGTGLPNDTLHPIMNAFIGDDLTIGTLGFFYGCYPSATGANRFCFMYNGDTFAYRPMIYGTNGLIASAAYEHQFHGDIYGDATIESSGTAKIGTGGSANKTMCWKSDGKTLGYCSSVVASNGSCTCN